MDTDDASRDFGVHRRAVEEAVHQLESDLVSLGRRFLDPERLDTLRKELDSFAHEHRPTEGFAVARVQDSLVEAATSSIFAPILDLPMAPFHALAGVEESPAAIREFTQTAKGFSSIVATLPMQLRWQVDLLAHDASQREGLNEALAAFQEIAVASRRLSDDADTFPDDASRILTESEGPLRELSATLRTARDLLEPLNEAATQIQLAGTAWESVVHRKQAGGQVASTNLDDWQQTALAVGDASMRLEAAADSLRELLHGGENPGSGTTGQARPSSQLRDLTDFLIWRTVLFVAILLGLALVYRAAAFRIAGHAEKRGDRSAVGGVVSRDGSCEKDHPHVNGVSA